MVKTSQVTSSSARMSSTEVLSFTRTIPSSMSVVSHSSPSPGLSSSNVVVVRVRVRLVSHKRNSSPASNERLSRTCSLSMPYRFSILTPVRLVQRVLLAMFSERMPSLSIVTEFSEKSIVPVVAVSETPGYSSPSFSTVNAPLSSLPRPQKVPLALTVTLPVPSMPSVADALLTRSVPSCTVQSPVKLWIFVRLILPVPTLISCVPVPSILPWKEKSSFNEPIRQVLLSPVKVPFPVTLPRV